ncbi:hypothetical protein [Nocardioides nanhaiensis]|uniref:hypothetical protein n=1 Tax=Nocardioides nanhaiensis TaxID=1476871 RepID=UPI0031EFD8D6
MFDATEYRTWALVATVSTVAMSLDLGTQSMAMRLPSTGPADKAGVAGLIPLAVMGPIGATFAFLAIWAVASTTFGETGFPQHHILIAIAITGIGCGWRSASNVTLALFLGLGRFKQRAAIVTTSAFLQLGATGVALTAGAGLFSLPIGVLFGSFVQWLMVITVRDLPRGDKRHSDAYLRERRSFAMSKGLVTALGLSVTQMDRWVLAVLMPVDIFRIYDSALRVVILGKQAIIVGTQGLVAESAASSPQRVFSTSLKIVSTLSALLFSASAVSAFFVLSATDSFGLAGWVVLLASAGHCVNLVTLPASLVLTGAGRPSVELWYVAPLAVTVFLCYWAALLLDDWRFAVSGWSAALVLSSTIFVFVTPSLLKRNAHEAVPS